MLTRILLPGLLLLPQLALARNAGWFLKGAATVEIAGTVEVPLYRGTIGDHRPMIAVDREVDGKKRSVLAIVDVGMGWTTVGRDLAGELGIVPEATDLNGEWAQVATVDALSIDGVTLRELRVQVVPGDELVIGFGALDELAVAVLPSKGVVKIAPASEGKKLVEEVGEAVPLFRQTKGKWVEDGKKVYGNGLSFAVNGSISGRDGRVMLDTARAWSRVSKDYRGTDERRRHGIVHYRGRGRLGSSEIAESWVEMDESLIDPANDFVGALGYDQLYTVDLAVSPTHSLAAVKKVDDIRYTPTVERVLELARARWEAAGLSDKDERSVRPPKLELDDGPVDPKELEGDLGDPSVMSLERSLARALWDAGKLEEAMPHYLSAAEAAGDRCAPQMELGVRRLAWSGSLQEQKFIIELIRQPLREAGELWDRWDALDPATRDKVRRYEDVPPGTFKIEQDRRCLTAWGTLMAAYVAQGNTTEASKIYSEHHGKDPVVAFAQGLSLLFQGQPKTAEIPIREALSVDVAESADFELGLGRALAEQGKKEAVEAIVDEIPGLDVEYPLTSALMAVHWGRLLGGDEGAKAMAERLVKQDPYWVPGQIAGLVAGAESANLAQVGAELVRQRGRYAGDLAQDVHAAVYTALNGDPAKARKDLRAIEKANPPTPDLYAGMAVVAAMRGKTERLDEAIKELRLRYPTIPAGDLGLVPAADDGGE
ncbi:MAG: hypothetical protein H6737_11595 [Alphaproteobacteria bacterium]|nr:hypothetical protein [Alphaproteobacteria bacterium]